MIIPTMMVANFPFVENVEGVYALAPRLQQLGARLLRRGARPAVPRRLAAAAEPRTTPPRSSSASRGSGSASALIRPIDAHGEVPELHLPGLHRRRADEHHGQGVPDVRGDRHRARHAHLPGTELEPAPARCRRTMASPGELIGRAGEMRAGAWSTCRPQLHLRGRCGSRRCCSSGMLDLYPKLSMAIFESNASWLPQLLAHWDRLFQLYANERALKRRPAAVARPSTSSAHRLRVRRDRRLPPVGALRERRRLVVGRVPPRRRRLVERDPRDDRVPACRRTCRRSCSAATRAACTASRASSSSPRSRRRSSGPTGSRAARSSSEWADVMPTRERTAEMQAMGLDPRACSATIPATRSVRARTDGKSLVHRRRRQPRLRTARDLGPLRRRGPAAASPSRPSSTRSTTRGTDSRS